MNLDNDQKKIWEESKKIKFSNIPDKDEVWQRLVQQMNSINQELDVEKNEHKSKSNKFIAWPNFDFVPEIFFAIIVITELGTNRTNSINNLLLIIFFINLYL